MAFETEYSLVCDRCQTRSETFDGAIFTKKRVITELRELGWVRRRGARISREGTECPACSGALDKGVR